MALSRKVCNVIVDKQRVSQIDPRLIQQSEKKFVNVKSSIEGSNSSRRYNNYYNIIMNYFIINWAKFNRIWHKAFLLYEI